MNTENNEAPCRVKIVKCSYEQGWYKNLIGEEFDTDLASPPKDYVLWEDYINNATMWRHISQEDCVRIKPNALKNFENFLSQSKNKSIMTDTNISGIPPAQQSEAATFGMKLVGIDFNPAGDSKVKKAKELCAQLADLVKGEYETRKYTDSQLNQIDQILYQHTIGEILNAQMNVVKLLTLKY